MPFDFPYDDWADIYDAVYADLTHDIDFYVEQARACGGPVLELGCGTGRVSLAIAAEGIDVTGIDISPRMIAAAQAKAERRGLSAHCIFQSGDMADPADRGSLPARHHAVPFIPEHADRGGAADGARRR